QPRAVLSQPAASASSLSRGPTRVIVKLREDHGLRAAAGARATVVGAVLAAHGLPAMPLRRLHTRPERELDAERERAMQRSGRQLADLNLYYVVDVPPGRSAASVIGELERSPEIEFAAAAPAPVPPPSEPPTPDFEGLQGYTAAAPAGLGV